MKDSSQSSIQPAADFNCALKCSNEAEAFGYLQKAAEAGCFRAQFLLGLAYHTGRGVTADYRRAEKWYCEAAAGGDSHAMANLGVINLSGQRATADDLDAYAWILSAVGLGREWLRPILAVLEQRISGVGDPAGDRTLASVAPENPFFRACSLPTCDPCRCMVD